MRDLEGVFVPVTTPFRGDDVAVEGLQANLRKWNATALAGYVVLGSTGEFPMLSEAERDQVLVAAREAIPRDKAFIAGTGANSTLHSIRQTKRAAEVGADLAIVITPHYFTKGFSQAQAQVRHYLAVAEASPIPVVIYNFPLNTGINLEADTVAKIAQHPNVCGIKDSSGNIPQAAQILDQTPKSFHVLVGAASALLPSLAIGSSGGILALGLVAAREFCDVYRLARGGRWDEAREIAARMMPTDRVVSGRYGIGGLKAALDLQGFYGGPCRPPLGTPDGDAIEDIKEALATAGLL
ncbi:MAG: dihydrodipicolinate synthase family protein [Candidatus Rokuibacteriota bacterium]|nr:MAG: dihydrodipicolinate synthase family protein [Candidatus Rokubacteria bacterium]